MVQLQEAISNEITGNAGNNKCNRLIYNDLALVPGGRSGHVPGGIAPRFGLGRGVI